MGRPGRSQRFLDYWNRRELRLLNGDVLRWVLIDDPAHGTPHAECFRLTSADGNSHVLHPTQAVRLLTECYHPDVEHVPDETHVRQTFTH